MTTEAQLSDDWWLDPVQHLINRGVVHSESATAICKGLEGRTLCLSVDGTALKVIFEVANGRVDVTTGDIEDPDATISGLPFSLLRMVGDDPEAVIRSGTVKITGNPVIADEFRGLFHLTRPDWEEELSRYTGDVIAHELGLGTRRLRSWGRRAAQTLARSMGEYLSEESRLVVSDTELEEFCADVDQLSAAVDRAAAKLTILRAKREAADDTESSP